MSVLDIVLIAGIVLAIWQGFRRGLVATLGMVIGVIVGGIAAWFLMPVLLGWLPSPGWRLPVVVFVSVLLPVLGGRVGAMVGQIIRSGVDVTPLRFTDRVFGALATVAAVALAYSLVASIVVTAGIPGVAPALASSRVVRTIDALIPAPIERALAGARSYRLPSSLGELGDLLGVGTPDPIPPVDTDDPAIRTAAQSVARISGVALACGTSSTGSGFVVGERLVMTNAHVVAGVDKPVVELPGGFASDGTVVYYDEGDDVAVVRLERAGGSPLDIAPTLSEGDEAIVAGYPLGGPLRLGGAKVMSVGRVPLMDVSGTRSAPREIYALAANVQPGNSGGPVLTVDGDVAGMVFARSADVDGLGYAMTPTEILPVIASLDSLTAPVATGSCS